MNKLNKFFLGDKLAACSLLSSLCFILRTVFSLGLYRVMFNTLEDLWKNKNNKIKKRTKNVSNTKKTYFKILVSVLADALETFCSFISIM